MKSNAPWSVKGIDKDARETAKAAAQRQGMTVGEWLNHIIFTAGDPNAAPTTGDIEGLRARDLAAAIEHLSRRIAAAESKGAAAVDHLARSLGGAVERLQRLERADAPSAGGDEALAARVRALEEKSTDRQRIEALRALERAVGQIAVQFSNSEKSTVARIDAAERQLQSIAERLDQGAGDDAVSASAVRDAIEGMAERIARAEKIAAEAAQMKAEAGESIDADFIQKTGLRLRILGDEIKRGGDQMRALESTIAKLSQQIDAAEKRSAEGVQKVAETIADLRDQFASADAGDQAAARAEIEAAVSEIAQRTEDRIEALQQSFDDMVRRLEEATGRVSAAGRRADEDEETAPAAAFAAEPPPRAEASPFVDIDSELEDAFAALELEEPIPTTTIPKADAAGPEEALEEAEDDDFGFESDDALNAGDEASETEDVLAEIREAFGIDAPAPADETGRDLEDRTEEETSDETFEHDEDDFDAGPAPVAVQPAEEAQDRADYLKAARQAAREAAAKAAAEEAAPPRKKLTPKQRAILAARIKRRKQEAEAQKSATPAAPVVERPAADDSNEDAAAPTSIKARVAGILSRLKNRGGDKRDAAEETAVAPAESDRDADAGKPAPNLLAGANAAVARLTKVPNAGGVIGLVGAIGLAAAAAFLMFKDTRGRKAERPAANIETPRQVAGGPGLDERISPAAAAEPVVRPRQLYLDNIAALKSATTDAEAKAALKEIEQAAALGHPPAQLQIGEIYKLGQPYDRDLGQARMWFERAANGGNVLAMHRLGVMAARGEGGPIDLQASIAWFEKAANFGLVDSQYNLGATYHPTPDGAASGVQDRAKAYFWYSVAARNGDTQAGEMAQSLAASMPANEKATIDAEVAAWAPKTPDPAANELAPAQ